VCVCVCVCRSVKVYSGMCVCVCVWRSVEVGVFRQMCVCVCRSVEVYSGSVSSLLTTKRYLVALAHQRVSEPVTVKSGG
jgi:hypothetical protein